MPKARTWITVFVFIATAGAVAQPPLCAQTAGTGAVVGTVTDPSGGVVPGVTVNLTNRDTGVQRTATTDAAGLYRFSLLSPGKYDLEFTAQGFKTQKQTETAILVTETQRLDIVMQVGDRAETITVEAETELIQSESTTLGRVVGETNIRNVPLSNRNYTQIVALSPGVIANVTNAAALGRNSQDVWANGGRAIDNNYQMDGVQINNFGSAKAGDWLGYSGIPIPNPDTIQEFKVQTSLYDATYGRGAGANVNVVTRSGSNAFHGNLFEFFRNDVLNANDFFLNRNGLPKPVLKQNQFGGTFGGSIVQSKLFFFASYQGTRQRNGVGDQSLQSAFLPPLTDDRSMATLGQQFCGQTGFSGGVAVACDGSNISPVAIAFLNAQLADGRYVIPTPQTINAQGIGFSVFSELSRYLEDQYLVNLDYVQSSKHTVSGRWFWSRSPQTTGFTRTGSNVPGSGAENSFRNTNLVLKLNSVLTSTFLNEVKLAVSRHVGDIANLLPLRTTDVGMTGTGELDNRVPTISVAGLFRLGGNNNDFQDGAITNIQLGEQISWQRGRHSLRIGATFDKPRYNFEITGHGRGGLSFRSFPDFLLGMSAAQNGSQFSNVFSSSAIVGPLGRHLRTTDWALFVQDDFKFHPQLTLNLGVRWELFGTISDALGQLTNFDPALALGAGDPPAAGTLLGYLVPTNFPKDVLATVAGNQDIGSTGNESCCGPMIFHNVAPRIGLAWRPFARSNRLVIRSGYGIFYARLSGNDYLQLVLQPPFTVRPGFSGVDNAAATFAVPFPAGIPQVPFWPLRTPTSRLNHSTLARNIDAPMTQQWNLNIQYEFLPTFLWEVGYVGAHGTRIYGTRGVNTPLIVSPANPIRGITVNTMANANQRRPVLGMTGLLQNESYGFVSHNSLQTSVTKRFSRGLLFLASYTWGKTLDDYSNTTVDFDSGRGGRYPGNGNLPRRLAWGPADFDRAHRFVFNYVWELPRPVKPEGFAGKLLNGWQVSGVITVQSGTPVTIQDQRAGSILAFDISGARFGEVCPGFTYSQLQTPGPVHTRLDNYFNQAAFCAPPVVGDGFDLGRIGRDAVRGPDQRNMDFAITKRTPVPGWSDSSTLEFRTEFFNLFNTPQFSNPTSTVPIATLGSITSTSVAARIIQFALKYNF